MLRQPRLCEMIGESVLRQIKLWSFGFIFEYRKLLSNILIQEKSHSTKDICNQPYLSTRQMQEEKQIGQIKFTSE